MLILADLGDFPGQFQMTSELTIHWQLKKEAMVTKSLV